jgi:FAD/FMN-containing dehydrogenase
MRSVLPSDNSFQAFGESLRGELIQPDDQDYDTARMLDNGMINRWARAIARCADVSDVITAVRFAREHELLLAVRGGGHNGGGLESCSGNKKETTTPRFPPPPRRV